MKSGYRKANDRNNEKRGEDTFGSNLSFYHYWQSEPYLKSFVKTKSHDKTFLYYDGTSIIKYLFFHWVRKWSKSVSKGYIEPYGIHPLPVSDQIIYWQPIFSRHVSDALVKLESYETLRSKSDKVDRRLNPYRSILFRALLLTFWKRLLFVVLGIIATNVLSMSIAILVKKLFQILNDKSSTFVKVIFMIFVIVLLQLADSIANDNFDFYMFRLTYIVQYSFSITLFQNGLSYRRKYFNNIEGYNSLKVCNSVLHSASPDSECSKNPLFCPALRYQNKDLGPQMFIFECMDSYYISKAIESIKHIVDFLSNFIYGIYLISYQVKVNIWYLYVVGMSFLVLIIVFEIISAYVLHFILYRRDHRITKTTQIIPFLPVIIKMLLDDMAINIINKSRNNELIRLFIRNFLIFLNSSLYIICTDVSFYLLLSYFINSVNDASVITEIDTAGFLTALYIFLKIFDSLIIIPYALITITSAFVSYKRVTKFMANSSPNFYISDNRFIGSKNMSSNINETTTELEEDVVVLYKDATFTWVNSRNDLLTKNYLIFLKNVDFELRRGEIAIVTGSQGSGKSNFIKSVLGEMTLVGGSMAVVPLHTSMPIFYASQDIWIERGTIRSNVLFGYRFDENIYNTVLKAVELKSDILTWEKGDMRVVSDNAHSLSGGQRVRMEMARAIYAYLIFNQVNTNYNNNKCSFLMCLDSSFNGLDPFVAKTVFDNLFNFQSGILVKEDLSVILTISRQSFDKCISRSDSNNFPRIPVYNILNESISYYSNLSDFLSSTKRMDSYGYASKSLSRSISYFSRDILYQCLSVSHTRLGRRPVTRSMYEESLKKSALDELSRIRFNPYLIYISPSVLSFIIFVVVTFALTVLDDLKFVLITNLTDYLSKNINDYKMGILIDLSEVKSHSRYLSKVVTIIILSIIILSLISVVFITVSCIIASRKIHEYSINSIFTNSSSVIKVKKQISKIITFLSCDTGMIDDDIPYSLSSLLISLIQTMIHLITLFYLIPVCIPFLLVSLFLIYQFLLKQYVNSSVNIKFVYLEIMSNINNVYENVISGPSIYRSFKKEWELFHRLVEHEDYHIRCKFLTRSIKIWCSISSNWVFSFATLFILVILIVFDRTTKYKLSVGYFGLWLSMSMKVGKTFTNFSINFARAESLIFSLRRFQYFIPPGQKCKFEKSINTNEEFLVVKCTENDYQFDKRKLLKRRLDEFKEANKRLLTLKRMFYKPKIRFIDLTKYVPTKHSGVELKNVHVYTSPEQNKDGAILKGVTVSAHRSDIIGIIGRTGAGKTTLLSVLQNTVRYRTGQVLLDGTDLKDIPKNVIRHIIGVIPQLPFVFKGWTVRRFLDPRKLFSDDQINQALDMCGLLQFVNDLQGGNKLDSIIINEEINLGNHKSESSKETYKDLTVKSKKSSSLDTLKTYYQESEMLLTGGQLRMLSFARLVLYRYFYRVIIVDEPPSEDNQSKNKDAMVPIYELLRKYFSHCTCFVTAHDANVLQVCNSVWAIHEGHLIRKCKKEEISANESISNIIEDILRTDICS